MSERKRLHISPLNESLLPMVLGPSILNQAPNVSYHTLQAFPERNYGYVDLPIMEADKIKKRLNGSILKGSKMKVEEARPLRQVQKPVGEEVTNIDEPRGKKARKAKRKTKREEGALLGYELPDNRKVKRGWTEPASTVQGSKGNKDKTGKKSKLQKSTFTEEPECLFKTKLAPNTVTLVDRSSTEVSASKKRKRGQADREITVHEFANTTKHASFLRDNNTSQKSKATTEYVDGKGWIDGDGMIVEKEVKRDVAESSSSKDGHLADVKKSSSELVNGKKQKAQDVHRQCTPSNAAEVVIEDDDETSSSGISSESESEDDDGGSIASSVNNNPSTSIDKPKSTGISSTIDDHKTAGPPPKQDAAMQDQIDKAVPTNAEASDGVAISKEVHPLEALFKRPANSAIKTPRKPTLEVHTSFSFFGSPAEIPPGTASLTIPQTPFTKLDFRQRRQRSAAPTPDTAAPGKTFGDLFDRPTPEGDEFDTVDEDDVDEEDGTAIEPPTQASKEEDANSEAPQSDFAKWFWEHRGETNRAWKRRRREAAKEKRKSDNKMR